MWLIPPIYPIIGVISMCIIFLYSAQQVCVSALSDRPRIVHRYLTSFYCLCSLIRHILLLCNLSAPENKKYVVSARIMILISVCIAAWLFYKFTIRSIHTVYSTAFTNASNEMPKWFGNVWSAITIINIVKYYALLPFVYKDSTHTYTSHKMSLMICYVAAYMMGSAIFFSIHDSILNLVVISGSSSVNASLWKIHYRLERILFTARKQLIEKQQSNDKIFIVEERNLSSKELTTIRKKIKKRISEKQKRFQAAQFDINENQESKNAYDSMASKFRHLDKRLSTNTIDIINRTITNEQTSQMLINKLTVGQRRVTGILFLTLFIFLISGMNTFEIYL